MKKFYKYIYQVVVVTDRKSDPNDIESLAYDINEGEAVKLCSGTRIKLSAIDAVAELEEIGYDPDWLCLDKYGNSTDDWDNLRDDGDEVGRRID